MNGAGGSESELILPPHGVAVALVHPRIAPNVGVLARLCVATTTALHLVRPFGFVLDDAKARRSGLDYWPRLNLTIHDDLAAFEAWAAKRRLWIMENAVGRSLWSVKISDGDVLVFGSETTGLPQAFMNRHADRVVSIPQAAGERCLNVASAASVAVYEALRQIGMSS